jgi:serine/threonine protein kinase
MIPCMPCFAFCVYASLYGSCGPGKERLVHVQVLCHVAMRLKMLHDQGWVHRDIKPGNILRLKMQHSWTLIDFGCVAQSGVPSYLLHLPIPSLC